MLNKLNGKSLNLEDVADPSIPRCTVIFEFGIAEANSFTYVDNSETNKTLKAINKSPFKVIDVYCAVRYYKLQNERRIPLKFDYYMIRFLFDKKILGMLVFHERGPRYIMPSDIINFITDRINVEFSRKVLKPLTQT